MQWVMANEHGHKKKRAAPEGRGRIPLSQGEFLALNLNPNLAPNLNLNEAPVRP
jgi:hypothetical protein